MRDGVVAELPEQIVALQGTHPWEQVAEQARARLTQRVPELEPYIAAMPDAVFGLTSGFFYLPAAQAEAWGLSNDQWQSELLLLLALGHAHFAAQDLQIDGGNCSPELCLLSDAALLSYLDGLRDRGPASDANRYLALHDLYYRWYVKALGVELRHRRKLWPFTRDEILLLGLKAAPGNTTLHLVADATGHSRHVDDLVRAVMQLCAGLQILDDLNDMSDDFEDGNITFPVSATLLALGVEQVSGTELDSAELYVTAVGTGIAATCTLIAQRCFDLASDSAEKATASVVRDLARVWHTRAGNRRAQLHEALEASGIAQRA